MKNADLIGHIKFLPWWQLDGCSMNRPSLSAKGVACETTHRTLKTIHIMVSWIWLERPCVVGSGHWNLIDKCLHKSEVECLHWPRSPWKLLSLCVVVFLHIHDITRKDCWSTSLCMNMHVCSRFVFRSCPVTLLFLVPSCTQSRPQMCAGVGFGSGTKTKLHPVRVDWDPDCLIHSTLVLFSSLVVVGV